MVFYSRKSARIPDYNYSSCNFYFLTICTDNRKCIFGEPWNLSPLGKIAEEEILQLESHYGSIHVVKFVVMPNHIHMIVHLEDRADNPDIPQIIAQYKSGVSRRIRKIVPDIKVWQRSFHDHIIRNENSFQQIWTYIEGNPQSWQKDCFYVDPSMNP